MTPFDVAYVRKFIPIAFGDCLSFRTARRLCTRSITSMVSVWVLLSAALAPLAAQRFGRRPDAPPPVETRTPYDGRFTFVRLKYTTAPGGFYYMGLPAWSHGYQRAENNLLRITKEISTFRLHLDASNVLALDDPELTKYPVAYMVEPGYWTMNDKEAAALSAYIRKGGFIIFDDFRDDPRNQYTGWATFMTNMQRVLPGARAIDLQPSHPIFHSFFEINSLTIVPQAYDRGGAVLRGIFEDNDPNKRMLAMVNFNTDVSQYWEFSGSGFQLVSDGNEAYKLGVNYLVYAMTH